MKGSAVQCWLFWGRYYDCFYFRQKIWPLTIKLQLLGRKRDHNIGFREKRHFCRNLSKIVIITLTPLRTKIAEFQAANRTGRTENEELRVHRKTLG
jgi:hypothetical protein